MIATLKVIRRNRPACGGDDYISSLRRLDASMGPSVNRNDRAIALISACIGRGIATQRAIIRTLYYLDFNPKHIVMMLKTNTGRNPSAYHWKLSDTGAYQLHD